MAFLGISGLATPIDNTRSLFKPSLSLFKVATLQKYVKNFVNVSSRSAVADSASKLNQIPEISCSNSGHHLKPVIHTSLSKGGPLSNFPAASSTFCGENLGGSLHSVPMQSHQCRCLIPPRAAPRYSPFGFKYPEITEKPVWWWRTLACIPYLLALQLSDAGYYLHPFTERYQFFENIIYYIPGACNRLPSWFSMLYCFSAYLLVVKNKNLPHFFRFHLMMGMLMEVALQLVWYISNFMPLIHYGGTFGVQYWGIIALAYIAVLLECIRCALVGKYSKIPFLDESAYIHTMFGASLKIGGIFG